MPKTLCSIPLLFLFFALVAAPANAVDSLSYTTQAQELLKQGEYEKALDELKAGFALFPYDTNLKFSLAAAYIETAQHDLQVSRYAEAAEYFGQARELSPDTKNLGLMRGISLYMNKQYDDARAELSQDGDTPDVLFYLGKISYDTGDLPGAVSVWRRGLELAPDNHYIKDSLAKAERELPVESRMDKGYSSMFDLTFDAELPDGLSAQVLDALESAYNTVGTDLGLFPTTRVPVILYTKSDYSAVTAGPDWSGGLYDGKIRLPVGGITKLTPQMRAVIFHEFTHVVIAELTHGNIPTWLNEGLAELEGRREFSHPTTELAKAAKSGGLVPLATLSGSFRSMSGSQALLSYEQSYSMADFMVNRFGWYPVQNILKGLGDGATIESAVAKGLGDYSLDLAGVVQEWQESLQQQRN